MNVYAGPPRALTRITLRLVPLTPVHIGDGTDMRLDEYLLEEPRRAERRYDEFGEEIEEQAAEAPPMLCHFDQAMAMRAMTPAQCGAFQRALDAGRLGQAAEVLRKAGRNAILERIPISQRSAAELKKALAEPGSRLGQVKPFVRSGGRPYIPGSSIKGAFRTALASAALPRGSFPDDAWSHENALDKAFGLKGRDTTTDPLRFLHVSDAFLPEGVTLIDKPEVVKSGGQSVSAPSGRGGIQMHYERTRSLIEHLDAPAFTVEIDVDRRGHEAACVSRGEAGFDAGSLFARCRAFHVPLFNAELGHFFEGDTKQTLLRKLLAHGGPDGQLPLRDKAWNPAFLLLRLGRFGHFESKSLEGVRRGHFPQAKNRAERIRPPNAWGATRTVTRDANNNPIPFGWVVGWVVKEEGV